MHVALLSLLLLALVGCAGGAGVPTPHCAARSLPTVQLTLLPEIVVSRSLELVQDTNRGRLALLRSLFESVGCASPLLVEKETGPLKLPNLSCTLPGDGEERIVVGAHFDRVSAGRGLVDNWSGAALLPALWLSLSHRTRRHSFEFVAFSAQAQGLAGSRSFVASLDAGRLRQIEAMVNLDGVGTGPLRADVGHSDRELVCDLWATAALIDLPPRARVERTALSGDYEPFRRAGIPVIDLSSLTNRDAPIDRARPGAVESVDEQAYYDSYRLLAVYLAILDERL